MQILVPVDMAELGRTWLSENGCPACAEPLPRELADSLPLTLVQPFGGTRDVEVLDRHAVRLYTWADTYEDAITECGRAAAVLKAMEGHIVNGTQVYSVVVSALPYPAHDPLHEDIPRACTTLDIYARATITEI